MKERIKLVLTCIIAIVVMVAVTACGGSNSGTGTVSGGSGEPSKETQDNTSVNSVEELTQDVSGAASEETRGNTSGETYELTVSTFQPAMAPYVVALKETCDALMEESGGSLNITVYDSGTLLAAPDVFKGVQNGLADIVFLPTNFTYDYFTVIGRLFELPFPGFNSDEEARVAYNKLCEEYPQINEECASQGLINLGAFSTGAYNIYLNDKSNSINSFADLKGKKIGVTDAYSTALIQNIGATPVFTTNADLYTSLDNGVYDGVLHQAAFLETVGCQDLINKVLVVGDEGALRPYTMMLMNKGKFDSLPEDLQQLIKEKFAGYVETCQGLNLEGYQRFTETIQQAGAEYIELSQDEIEQFRNAAKPISEACIQEVEATGIPGQEIYDKLHELSGK